MAPILYLSSLSPPSGAVLITAQAVNVELELRNLDLSKGEHHAPEYTKLNPLHSVPTLDDNGIIITDSHAINSYLVRKFAGVDNLYPKDFGKRALVDQRLHFDTGILFNHFRQTAAPIFYRKSKEVPQEQKNRVLESYSYLETFLNNSEWIAGDEVTIADFSIGTTVLALNLFVPLNFTAFPKTGAWIRKFQDLESAKVYESVLANLKEVVEKCMA